MTTIPFYKTRKFKKYVFVILMLLWPMAHFAVFWGYINSNTILLTFRQLDRFGQVTGTPMSYYFVGLDNYKRIFKSIFFPVSMGGDIVLRNGFLNSFYAVFINIIVLLPMAILSAYVLSFKIKGDRIFRTLFYLPNIISIVVLTMLYKYMFNANFGPINALFQSFGVEKDWFDIYTKSTVIWPIIISYCIWAGLGMNVILLSSAISRIPIEILESCRLDGVGFWRQLFQIIIPLVWTTISTQLVLGMLAMFNFFIQPFLLVGGSGGYEGQTMTLSIFIFNTVQGGSQSGYTTAATVGVLFCLLGTPLIFFVKWLTERFYKDVAF